MSNINQTADKMVKTESKQNVKKKFHFRTSFWNRIPVKIMLIFILLLLPVYLLSIYNAFSYVDAMQEQILDSVEELINLENEDLSIEMTRQNYYLYQVENYNDDYRTLCNHTDELDGKLAAFNLEKMMQQALTASNYNLSLFLYNQSGTLVETYTFGYKEKHDMILDILRTSNVEDILNTWTVLELGGSYYDVHLVENLGIYEGAAIYMDSYISRLEESLPLEDSKVIVDSHKNCREDGFLTVTAQIPKSDFYVHVLLNQKEIRSLIPVKAWVYLFAAILLSLCLPLIFIGFWRMIVRPMGQIRYGFLQLGSGDTEYRIEGMNSSVEFNDLAHSFNSMASEIKDLKIETYEKKLENEKMKMQNLLLQIRPHFLLNTLNQIFSMAQLQDFDGVQRMSLYLSKYFRYLFRPEPLSPLSRELEVLEDYLGTMELRYADCFTVSWNVPEDCLNVQIPPLLIHNFVENIFKYAVGEGQEIEIGIAAEKKEDRIEICISDDGPGMDPQILKSIQEGQPIKKSDGTHIGIWNSRYRLKTFCGEKADLFVESVWAEGTTVRIILPTESEAQKKQGE